ncbi:MAM and LDL-receptor class A domain-containing protein 1-like [Lytechinus variegatus]|uniref:MAM and LDL-receptor class A domain-containing protein 1-like n=1 Tax=Lytechinus variegatus TaxID=7654 RepID=UPI001BB215BC|nr:MAM and LDL-receptor class A domain-containing protein 1-like [Lytechinus variegatus]
MMFCFSAILLALTGIASGQDCNFDANRTSNQRCGWSNDYEDDFDWSVRRLPSPTPFTGPSGDHTTGSGNFLYTEANGRDPGESARIYSPFPSPANEAGSEMTLISFWYSMWDAFDGGSPIPGTNMGTLNVYIVYNVEKVRLDPPIWSRSGSQTDRSEQWKEARILFTASHPFRIIFEGVIGEGERSDIGIDDIVITQPKMPTSCDFEGSEMGDLCFFYQEDLEDHFDWTRHSGETPSLDTGPRSDHTFQNNSGHYMYIETTRPNGPAKANLKSVQFFKQESFPSNDSTVCYVDFYYHAFGEHVGELQLFIKMIISTNGWRGFPYPIVSPGQSNDTWVHLNFPLPINDKAYYTLEFIGSRGNGNLGDIAIDDISLSEGCFASDPCGSNPCFNGGTCATLEHAGTTYYCYCLIGWEGEHCETEIDYCENNPCREGYICHEEDSGYICLCPEGYQGYYCDEKIPTVEPPEPIDIRIDGVNPEMIPVIIGSCIGSFILIVTAAWFTATCIKNDGYRRKEQVIEGTKNIDAEEGESNAYVNATYNPEDPDDEGKNVPGPSGLDKEKRVEVEKEVLAGSDVKEKTTSDDLGEPSEVKGVKTHDYEDVKPKPSSSENKTEDQEKRGDVVEDVEEVMKTDNDHEDVKEVESKPEAPTYEDVREVEKVTPTDLSTKYDEDSPPQTSEENDDKGVVYTTSL